MTRSLYAVHYWRKIIRIIPTWCTHRATVVQLIWLNRGHNRTRAGDDAFFDLNARQVTVNLAINCRSLRCAVVDTTTPWLRHADLVVNLDVWYIQWKINSVHFVANSACSFLWQNRSSFFVISHCVYQALQAKYSTRIKYWYPVHWLLLNVPSHFLLVPYTIVGV